MATLTAPGQENLVAHERKGAERVGSALLRETLEKHALWLDSSGADGVRADFSVKNLGAADLVDARLEGAVLNRTNLKAAELTLADLRGASLVQANLVDANLLGTQLQQANLQATDFRGATGLVCAQLAGTNLFGAILPEGVSPGAALQMARRQAETAGWMTVLMLVLNGLAWLRVFTTPDAQLLKNGSALPISAAQVTVPFIPFYLFAPVVIFCLYLLFHLSMQGLWNGIAQLPAIFPDGKKLDACVPWFARWSPRKHFEWLRSSQSPSGFLEAGIAILVLYWVTPATLIVFWARYLTLEDLRGTTLHALLVAGAILAAQRFPKMAGQTFGPGAPARANGTKEASFPRAWTTVIPKVIPGAAGLALFLLSIGIFWGVPHDDRSSERLHFFGARAWAADILWTAGYNPFAQLTEADVSTKPLGWTGRDQEIAQVKGANLNRLRLYYIQGYGAFFVKARLWQANLRHAYLSEADLREANMRQADLRFATLDHAKLASAALPEADLRNVTLDRADLRGANLSFVKISDATLLDATLDGANMYKADVRGSFLQRASLKKADLREANLEHADLAMANLSESYLAAAKLAESVLKRADLSNALLTDTSMRKADLSGATLRGAVLRDADLSGANLQGADLRGAEGLSATQLCAAASLRDAQLDDNLQQQTAALCATLR